MKYERLFEPLRVRDALELRNRLVMAPMTTTAGEVDGRFSSEEISYLARRAQAGVGMIITPACYVHTLGHAFARQVGCHSDAMMPGLTACAEAINSAGSASILQIHHGGNAAKSEFIGGSPWAPSAVLNRRGTSQMPIEMTEDQIWEIVGAFASAAVRAREAGFTGVEIHGANTYLFQQFFSPFTNQRTDRWGCGSMEDRCRFASEVVRAIRDAVGSDYLVLYRISPEEEEPNGYSVNDAVELLRQIVPLGIDMVHVSSWEYGEGVRNDYPEGSHPTRVIRDALPPEKPVIGVGGIVHPDRALKVLEDSVELVAIGKALLMDADWVGKVIAGQVDNIRTEVPTQAVLDQLEVPSRMKDYLARFFLADGN